MRYIFRGGGVYFEQNKGVGRKRWEIEETEGGRGK